MTTRMLEYNTQDKIYTVCESLGLEHFPQIIEFPFYPKHSCNPAQGKRFVLRDLDTGESLRGVISRGFSDSLGETSGTCLLVEFSLSPWQVRRLRIEETDQEPGDAKRMEIKQIENGLMMTNGSGALKLPCEGEEPTEMLTLNGCGAFTAGPLRGISFDAGQNWHGRSFIDTYQSARKCSTTIVEENELRCRILVTYDFVDGGMYTVEFVQDVTQPFIRIREEFSLEESAQMVIDFPRSQIGDTFFRLDTTPAYESIWLHWGMDHSLACLGAWSQQSQLTLSDGYAFQLSGEKVLGCFTVHGGNWRGNRLNSLDAWVRRWRGDDPRSRRLVPAESKADGSDSVEQIPARDRCSTTEHLSLEGWLGCGKREWGLLLSSEKEFVPPAGDGRTEGYECLLGHFDDSSITDQYSHYQGLLRQLHIRHGIFPLQKQLQIPIHWEKEAPTTEQEQSLRKFLFSELLDAHLTGKKHSSGSIWTEENFSAQEQKEWMQNYLRTRMETFWYGAGIISTNPVSSRRIAPLMYLYEYLSSGNFLSDKEEQYLRAAFSFLCGLMYSPDYYPGWSAMLAGDDVDALDPTLRGMANQNFYTDVYNIPGTGAFVLKNHPDAAEWGAHFSQCLKRQLEFHVYPNSGIWEESHTYYQHVLSTLLPLLLRLQDAGQSNWFADQSFRKMASAALLQITPRDNLYNDKRHLIPFGDHGGDPDAFGHIWLALAKGFAKTDTMLAASFLWMYQETGGNCPENHSALSGIAPTAPAIRDAYIEGLGVLLRGTIEFGKEKSESLLALRSGQAWGHHHHDEGSLWLYAGGQMLLGDSACGENQSEGMKFSARGHSRWVPQGYEPANYLWRFNRGHVVSSNLSGDLPFAVTYTPVILNALSLPQISLFAKPSRHYRALARLWDGAFLLIDRTVEEVAQELHFHLRTPTVQVYENHCWSGEYNSGIRLDIRSIDGIESGSFTGVNTPSNSTDAGGKSRSPEQIKSFQTSHLVLLGGKKDRESIVLLEVSGGNASQCITVSSEQKNNWVFRAPCGTIRLRKQDTGEYYLSSGNTERKIVLQDLYTQ